MGSNNDYNLIADRFQWRPQMSTHNDLNGFSDPIISNAPQMTKLISVDQQPDMTQSADKE